MKYNKRDSRCYPVFAISKWTVEDAGPYKGYFNINKKQRTARHGSLFTFLCECFWKGCGGTLFFKKRFPRNHSK